MQTYKKPMIRKKKLVEQTYKKPMTRKKKLVDQTLNLQRQDIELQNRMQATSGEYSYLYPSLDDPNFNVSIASRKEFYDTRYERPKDKGNIEDISDALCNASFELAPHQMFVRNFLSFQTPYNGMLLFHGLGSGKTCSAISVSEEMRNYLKQMGLSQRIIIVASPNVQQNFYLQMFDERKLELIDGLWNIRACTGNKYLSEINPMHMKGLTKDKVIRQIKRIIQSAYLFLGYIEFANYIKKKSEVSSELTISQKTKVIKQKLLKTFQNRLIIIDEIHNIRMTEDNKDKLVSAELLKLVNNVPHMRLLLLSATPMYNTYKEIIWILNLLNINDGRSTLQVNDVFQSDGSFKVDEEGEEIGRDMLTRKATGYVSFVRGDNPYTFPYRLWPNDFEPSKTLGQVTMPTQQMNGMTIMQPIEMLHLYFTEIGTVQEKGYQYIIQQFKEDTGKHMPSFENMEKFGYTMLQRPLEALNIVYPHSNLEEEGKRIDPKELVGKNGLKRIMKYKETTTPLSRGDFEYRTTEYGRLFSLTEIGKYSCKIEKICKTIAKSDGIILIYSQYIDGGLIPMALALEEMGLRRAGGKSLFKTQVSEPIDANTFQPKSSGIFSQASYVMITGDKALSPDNVSDLKRCTDIDNKDGEKVKVILISQAGSEGLDFKYIRQVHVLEPWYNMNRIEQIIGRAVRQCSHKDLPFQKRNVQIFLYGTLLSNPREEAVDIYVYRLAELKAIQIGLVSRALKEVSVDCLLNFEQTGFNADDMKMVVKQTMSTQQTIDYVVGDKPFSSTCDYLSKCTYECKPTKEGNPVISMDTYNETFIQMNIDKILQRIRDCYKERFFYTKEQLIHEINANKHYPLIQINSALHQMVIDNNEYIVDMYGRIGRLVNIGELYLFQPLEINNLRISRYERSVPIEYKRRDLQFEIPKEESIPLFEKKTTKNDVWYSMKEQFETSLVVQTIDTHTDDWYKICSVVIPHLKQDGWKQDLLETFIVHHIIESLLFEDTLSLLNYMETLTEQDDVLLNHTRAYFKHKFVHSKDRIGLQLQNLGKQQLIVSSPTLPRQWSIAKPQDYEDLSEEITKNIQKVIPIQERLNKYIGSMVIFKKDYMVFKIRDMSQSRNSGARCDQASKIKSIKILTDVLEETQYTVKSSFSRYELCIIQEFWFRHKDLEQTQQKRWFLTPYESILMNEL